MILPLILVALLLQVPDPIAVEVSVNSLGKFGFDWSGNHADGSPMAKTEGVEFHYMPVPPDGSSSGGHLTIKLPFVAVIGENVITMKDSLKGVPAGVYDLSIVLVGPGGNRSAHSAVIQVQVNVLAPEAATGLRVVE